MYLKGNTQLSYAEVPNHALQNYFYTIYVYNLINLYN